MKVSVAIIALNEECYLPKILDDIRDQTYPLQEIELLLIDSMSVDKTRAIMEEFKRRYHNSFFNILILENKKKIQAAGCNVAIRNYTGEALIRIDAHIHILSSFIAANVECIQEGEYVCGGRCQSIVEDEGKWKKVLLGAEESSFGSGIAPFRNSGRVEYVNTVAFGIYRREVYSTVGEYNELLGRTEDNDMNYRVRKAGYKIGLRDNIVSYHYMRPSLHGLLRQKFLNGYWIGRTLFVQPRCLDWYHFIPFVFLVVMFSTLLLAVKGITYPLLLMILLYGMLLFATTISLLNKNSWMLLFLMTPFICFLIHIIYGCGTLIGIVKGK